MLFEGHPSWLSTPWLYIRGLLIALLVGVLAGLASAALTDGRVHPLWVTAGVALVFLRVSLKSAMRRARTTYTITDRRVTVRIGLLSRQVREARLDYVLGVSSRQTPLERLIGVGTVNFDTPDGHLAFRGVAEPRELAHTVARVLRSRP